MENNVPYIVFEGEQARSERHIRRLWIVVLVLITLLFASNAIWLYAWTRYDYLDVDVDSGDQGIANYIGRDGDITNGKNTSEIENEKEW